MYRLNQIALLFSAFASLLLNLQMSAQIPFPVNLTTANWEEAGMTDTIPFYNRIISVSSYGADNSGKEPVDQIVRNILLEQESKGPYTLFFPEGHYLFKQPLILHDSIVIKGAGAGHTRLLFDLDGRIQDAIQIRGTFSSQILSIGHSVARGDSLLSLVTEIDQSFINKPKFVFFSFDDTSLMESTWAYGLAGALFPTIVTGDNELILKTPMRINVDSSLQPNLRFVKPISGVGLECLSIERLDATSNQTSNVYFDLATHCWVIGVESFKTNFGHIDCRRSAYLEIRGNYLHDAFSFGGGGRAYGVVLQSASSLIRVSNNCFRRLRHAVLLQSGANANVISFNYSIEPFWTQVSLPSNSAGDMVCHGNYPYLNLFEGNLCQNIVVDASHGLNGPHNYFFRNRADTYGIFMSPGSGTDSTHFMGNEVTSTTFLQGLYSLIGRGNIEYGNRVRGQIRPIGTTGSMPSSLYLSGFPPFWEDSTFPFIGEGDLQISSLLPAKSRFEHATYTDCTLNPKLQVNSTYVDQIFQPDILVFPNPTNRFVTITYEKLFNVHVFLFNQQGTLMKRFDKLTSGQTIDLGSLNPGNYLLQFSSEGRVFMKKIVLH